MATNIFDFDNCAQTESDKVRYWGSEGYGGPHGSDERVTQKTRTGRSQRKRKRSDSGYCPSKTAVSTKKKKVAKRTKRKKLTQKQLKSVKVGTHLKLWWPPTKTWSYGEVMKIYDDGIYEIACHDDPEDQGALCYHLADYNFKVTDTPHELEYHKDIKQDPHSEASRRSPRKPKKRKFYDIDMVIPRKDAQEGEKSEVGRDGVRIKINKNPNKYFAMDTGVKKIEINQSSEASGLRNKITKANLNYRPFTELSSISTHQRNDDDGRAEIAVVALNKSR